MQSRAEKLSGKDLQLRKCLDGLFMAISPVCNRRSGEQEYDFLRRNVFCCLLRNIACTRIFSSEHSDILIPMNRN